MSESPQTTYAFGAFVLDRREKKLDRNGQLIPLTPKVFDTLECLVRHHRQLLTKDDLMKEVWPNTFVDDATLAQNISILRKALGDSVDRPVYIETIPKRGYRFIADVASGTSAPTLEATAWIDVRERSQPVRPTLRVWLAAVLLVLTTIGVIAFVMWPRPKPAPPQTKTVLVVLPFDNFTGDLANEYISDGLTEELIAQLGNMQPDRLGVIARTSATKYRNAGKNIEEIGKALGASYALEGSIRQEGVRLRVTVQMIQVQDQTHLWSEQYDYDKDNLLTMQFEVAQLVARRIQTGLSLPVKELVARGGTRNPLAFEAYLKARHIWSKRGAANATMAVSLYQRAVELDPRFVQAYIEMSQAQLGFASPDAISSYRKAQAAARQALAIDETHAGAHFALAGASLHLFDWATAAAALKRAQQLDPAARLFDYSLLRGDFAPAISTSRQAIETDPANFLHHHGLGMNLYYARQFAESLPHFRDALQLESTHVMSSVRLGQALSQLERYNEAIDVLKDTGRVGLASLGYVYARVGRKQEALDIVNKMRAEAPNPASAPSYDLALVYTGLGDHDSAFSFLNLAFEQRVYLMIYLKVEPCFDPLRADPRYDALVRRIGFPD